MISNATLWSSLIIRRIPTRYKAGSMNGMNSMVPPSTTIAMERRHARGPMIESMEQYNKDLRVEIG
ncbi:hypothetical protein CR513_24084, partial [Mucuna pruriens]